MNKQEALKKIEKLDGLTIKDKDFNFDSEMIPKGEALEIVNQIDEHQKVVVPKFVADWIEDHKGDYSKWDEEARADFVFRAINDLFRIKGLSLEWDFSINEKISELTTKNAYEFITAILFGYTVEKEKLYTVKFANEDFGKMYIGIFKKFNKLGISSLSLNDDEVKSWFTEDELKRFKFWDNPAFEIEEVEE